MKLSRALLALVLVSFSVSAAESQRICRVTPGQAIRLAPGAWGLDAAAWSEQALPDWLKREGQELVGRVPENGGATLWLESRAKNGPRAALAVDVQVSSRATLSFEEGMQFQARPFETIDIPLASLLAEPGCGTYTWGLAGTAPGWLTIVGNTLRGTPRLDHAGKHRFRVYAISQGVGASANIEISVDSSTFLPERLDVGLLKVGRTALFPVPRWIQHPQGASLRYRWLSKPQWLLVKPDGTASGTPLSSDMGPFEVVIETSTSIGVVGKTSIVGTVVDNLPPVWSQSPLQLPIACTESNLYRVALKSYVSDPDGDKLEFNIPLPPFDELKLSSDGWLEFKPEEKHEGRHEIFVEVSDGRSRVGVKGTLVVSECRN